MDEINLRRSGNRPLPAMRQNGEAIHAERSELSDFRFLARLKRSADDVNATIRICLVLVKESKNLLRLVDRTLRARNCRTVARADQQMPQDRPDDARTYRGEAYNDWQQQRQFKKQ